LRYIVTHPGGAHKDELLACALLIADHPIRIFRRSLSADDLAASDVAVVDIGHCYQPELLNFDHHQFDRGAEPTCSVSLVLQHLGLYQAAQKFCKWLPFTERLDCYGPQATADWLGLNRSQFAAMNSPLDIGLLSLFGQQTELCPGDPLFEIIRSIGAELINFLKLQSSRITYLEQHVQVWDFFVAGQVRKVLFLAKSSDQPDRVTAAFSDYIESANLAQSLSALVYPDSRSEGYGLKRFEDASPIYLSAIATEPDVHFVHASGFLAKTSASDSIRIRQLLEIALKA
tara:strand:+ start:1501 stop:2361 length:861 start_codon:yes stop_codon:yes gene_type:complete